MKHWLKQHRFINSILNRFGKLCPQKQTFHDRSRFEIITRNPLIVETNISSEMFDQNSIYFWKKRAARIWKEINFDDSEFLGRFPTCSEEDLHKLTGGPYQLRKAKAYRNDWIKYMIERKNSRKNRENQSESQTDSQTGTSINLQLKLKIQLLADDQLRNTYPNFKFAFRADVPSFYSRWKKYQILILVQQHPNFGYRYSFGCCCNTGHRSSPCCHGVLMLYLYQIYFKEFGFPQN